MKKIMLILMILLLDLLPAVALEKIEPPETCRHCGMSRSTFAQSRMLVLYVDKTEAGVCSLHCAALELQQNSDKQPGSLLVADYHTKELIDAGKAVWVVGGKKQGIMTILPKWAFAGREGALKFREENGGNLSSFDQALNSATLEVQEQAAEEIDVKNEMLREMQ